MAVVLGHLEFLFKRVLCNEKADQIVKALRDDIDQGACLGKVRSGVDGYFWLGQQVGCVRRRVP
jgi:hypothetical protein